MSSKKAFRLSTSDRMLVGVCGGIAKYFNVDSAFVRLGTVFLTLVSPEHLVVPLIYVVCWAVFPEENNGQHTEY